MWRVWTAQILKCIAIRLSYWSTDLGITALNLIDAYNVRHPRKMKVTVYKGCDCKKSKEDIINE